MFVNEIITESLSRVAFHYTSISTALKIVTSGQFELSSALGSIEQQYMPQGKPYFLSTTRTRRGGYHDNVGRTSGVLFALDGNWFNQRYKSRSLDYWGNRNPTASHHRAHEAEDRVFSAEPSIPINGVTAIHVLYQIEPGEEQDKLDAHGRAMTRELLIAAKRRGIATYFYTDKTAWQNMDTRNLGDVKLLTGAKDKPWFRPRRRNSYLQSWIELMTFNDPARLGKEADKIRYGFNYKYNLQDAVQALDVDLGNARKPDAGDERAAAIKIIAYMRQHRLTTIADFVNHLAAKWKQIDAT
jgi:hypothetical protein